MDKLLLAVRSWADLMADRLDLGVVVNRRSNDLVWGCTRTPSAELAQEQWCKEVFDHIETRVTLVTSKLKLLVSVHPLLSLCNAHPGHPLRGSL